MAKSTSTPLQTVCSILFFFTLALFLTEAIGFLILGTGEVIWKVFLHPQYCCVLYRQYPWAPWAIGFSLWGLQILIFLLHAKKAGTSKGTGAI